MEALFRLVTFQDSLRKAPVVKAGSFSYAIQVDNLEEEVVRYGNELIHNAQELCKKKSEDGYIDGRQQGIDQNADRVLESVLLSVEFIENIEKSLVEIVMSTIRETLNKMSPRECIVSIVRTALSNIKSQSDVVVRVSPADERAVFEAFEDTVHSSTRGGFLSIIADARLVQGSCLLETEYGVIDASLDLQIKALDNAFYAKIRS